MSIPSAIDRYEVIDRLGQGGMGIVYRARDPRLGRRVAIKVLAADDERFRQRFLQEAQLAATLHHRNIVTVFDYGEHESRPFIVMEYIEGATIADYLHRRLPLSLERKLDLLRDLATALDYAHNRRIVHRDIKPANLMIDAEGVLKILDFGVARVSESQLTQVGMMIGTPSYMAPEQIEGRPADRRTDVFAVGVTAYELLSLHKAFPDQTSVIRAVLTEDPTPLRTLMPDLDPELDRIVRTALQKDPGKRYASLALMADDLAPVLARYRGRPQTAVTRADEEMTREVVTPFPIQPNADTRVSGHSAAPSEPVPPDDRTNVVEKALARARAGFAAGRYQSALAAAAEVLDVEPANQVAVDLTRLSLGAIERNRPEPSGAIPAARYPPTQLTPAPQPPSSNWLPWTLASAATLLSIGLVFAGWRLMKPPTPSQDAIRPKTDATTPSAPAPPPSVAPAPPQHEAEKRVTTEAPRTPVVTPPPGPRGRRPLETACDGGDAAKCFELAQSYQSGEGVVKDPARAATLFERACDKGNGRACFELALAYRSGTGVQPDISRVVALFQRACDETYASGCTNVGLFYLRGTAVNKDEARSMTLFQRACDGGDAAGCFNIGRGYDLGQGVPRDSARAVALYQRGCSAGNANACANFGSAYFRGAGIEKDEPRAITLFRRACDDGSSIGCTNLGVAFTQGRGVAKDDARAAELFQQACDKDNALGCARLGLMYGRGAGVARDEARSVTLFQRACDGGNSIGCMNLAFAYAVGRGTSKDEGRAAALYQQACEAGTSDGCTRAAAMFEQGRGVAKDAARASALYQRGRDLIAKDPDGTPAAPAGGQPPQRGAGTSGPPAPQVPTKIKDVRPTYPTGALYARVQGDVVIELTIGTDGKVQQTKIVRSIPLLDAAAEDAVKQWQFTPTVVNGKPVPVTLTASVKFSLTSPNGGETSVSPAAR